LNFMDMLRRLAPVTIFLSVLFGPTTLSAQKQHPQSPVFKDYKTPDSSIGIQQSDVTYQLWQGFMVARKANAGDPLAQHELGIRYLTGRGIEPDTVKAAYWIRRAAEHNVITAHFNLGLLLVNGWGVNWDPFEAYHHFLYAAEHNMSQAQYVMGQFFAENLVVSRDWAQAFRWVKLAADSGFAPAIEALALFEKRAHSQIGSTGPNPGGARVEAGDTTWQKKKSPSLQASNLIFLDLDAVDTAAQPDEWTLLREALASGSVQAQSALGFSSLLDDTLALDTVRLVVVRRAANVGSPEALTVLGKCYEKGVLVEKDWVKAAEYYARALRLESPRAGSLLMTLMQQREFAEKLKWRAEHSDPDAQVAWAGLFAMGLDPFLAGDTHLTEEAAFQLLKRAAREDHVPGLVELGVWYYSGRGVRQDKDAAREEWDKAVRLGSREAEVQIAVAKIRESHELPEVEQAIRVLSDASRDGSILATVALAYCYENGIGFVKHDGEAAKLYRRAAQRGSQEAYSALKRMYDTIRPPSEEFQIRE
jgi:TPR repeat protein